MQVEWWKAGEIDEYNLKNKLLRVGCRPLKRKFLACKASADDMDPKKFAECKKVREEMDECYKALHYLQISMK
jgi:hypothetical protein